MSEFQEAHTVSTLKGLPPPRPAGRRRRRGGGPAQAVQHRLLDEVEAHSDVHELFFQVFDKGWMEDGEPWHQLQERSSC
jgi:type VI secretion system protein VasG